MNDIFGAVDSEVCGIEPGLWLGHSVTVYLRVGATRGQRLFTPGFYERCSQERGTTEDEKEGFGPFVFMHNFTNE
jgi:hypothetical protein